MYDNVQGLAIIRLNEAFVCVSRVSCVLFREAYIAPLALRGDRRVVESRHHSWALDTPLNINAC